jgi:hypothetical protein
MILISFMDADELAAWLPPAQQQQLIEKAIALVGVTRVRAECFVRLWVYLLVKEQLASQPRLQPPLLALTLLTAAVSCTHREAAEIFYHDRERGSDRSAGMMLDKLAALGLIKKHFDGNTTRITIQSLLLATSAIESKVELQITEFDPRCDAIAVANLLAHNYSWMNRDRAAMSQRIAQLLRRWSRQYPVGMRVLRRQDNSHPVGFCLLYPTASVSDAKFFGSPTQGSHLSSMTDIDPFELAVPGDQDCVSVFVRSWTIELAYIKQYRPLLLLDAQVTLQRMQADFPQLCDLYTLIVHPMYEEMAIALGFQKTISSTQQPGVSWMYLPLDRFLSLDAPALSF